MKKVVIVLPTYNEKENVKTLIPEIFRQAKNIADWQINILVVDDNSPDHTAEVIKKLRKIYPRLYLIEGKKHGLGKAYLRGFTYSLANLLPDVIFEMDADWSHNPSLISTFLKKIDAGADFVIGSRYIKGGSMPANWEIHRKFLSWCANQIIRFGFMIPALHDWTSGYRAIRADFIKKVISSMHKFDGYVFQVALLDRAKKNHLAIAEIPLNFLERKSGKSKINAFQYIVNTLTYVFLNSSFIKFCIVGFIGFIINVLGLEIFFRLGLTPAIAAAIGAEFSIISNFILNNFWSFSHKKIARDQSLLNKFLQFNIVSTGSIVIQFITVGLGTYFFGPSSRFIFLLISVIVFIIPYSYFMYNRFIWKTK